MSKPEQLYDVQVEHSVPVPMRDGTLLSVGVFRPKADGRWPVLVGRDGYDPQSDIKTAIGTFFSQRGFVYVISSTRGAFQSEGTYFPFINDVWDDICDGYDTIEWASHHSWSDGYVGMYGISYTAFTQYMTAPTRPPDLKACLPIFGGSPVGFIFPHGIYSLENHRGWAVEMALCCLPGIRTDEDKTVLRTRLEKVENELDRWLEMDQWPPADITYSPIHLRQGTGKTGESLNNGQLTFELPNVGELPDTYAYDPADPIIGHWPSPETDELHQNERESRLLTYTTEVLQEPVRVIGPVKAVIYASSSAPDTDWVVRLCDVWPDGRSVKICYGILRARFRNSLEQEELMEPGETYRFEIDMVATAQTFLSGHRIRVHVTSSDFPRYDRNLNTGGPFGEEREGQIAINTIYHDVVRASHVVLPILKSM